jgi:uncharacterized SAM-binding protein YcdF (DUF218 family)
VRTAPTRTQHPARPILRSWRYLLLLLLLLIGCALAFRNGILNRATRFLVSSDPLQKADLLYILGGNYAVRAPVAAVLLRAGWAPKVLLAREPEAGRGHEDFTDITQRILMEHGVPRDRILEIAPGGGVRSTADEAHALRLYLDTYPRATVLVVTSAFHTRRARLALSRAVPGNVRIRMFAADDPVCPMNAWPANQRCQHEIELEWIKLLYYFFTFFG